MDAVDSLLQTTAMELTAPEQLSFTQRRDYLKRIVSSLRRSEARYLISELSKVDFRMDILANLPVELQVLVADYADLTDVHNFLQVSRRWKQIWQQPYVARTLSARHTPHLLLYSRHKEAITGVSQDLTSMFLDEVRDCHVKHRGRFRSVLFSSALTDIAQSFPLDPAYHPAISFHLKEFLIDIYRYEDRHGYRDESCWDQNPHSAVDMPQARVRMNQAVGIQYNNGRLTWDPPRGKPWIIVDNLRTQLRTVYTVPSLVTAGRETRIRALGDRLLVAEVGRFLHAWDLETHQHDTVTLPGHAEIVRTAGNRVWVMFSSGNVKYGLWVFRRGIRPLETREMDKDLNSPPDAIIHYDALLHPLVDSILWVVVFFKYQLRVIVCEFDDGIYRGSRACHIPDLTDGFRGYGDITIDIRKASKYGEYLLVESDRDGHGFKLVCFNILESKFFVRSFDTDGKVKENPRMQQHALWDGQLFSYVPRSFWNKLPYCNFTGSLITVSDSHGLGDRQRLSERKIPVYDAKPSRAQSGPGPLFLRRNLFDFRKQFGAQMPCYDDMDTRLLGCNTRYCLGFYDFMRDIPPHDVGKIWVDDGYIIAAVKDHWVAWSFDTDLALPYRVLDVDVSWESEHTPLGFAPSGDRCSAPVSLYFPSGGRGPASPVSPMFSYRP